MFYIVYLFNRTNMALTLISSYNDIIQKITLYYGIPVFCFGVIGALLNILVFLSWGISQHKSCVFYLIVMSILDLSRFWTNTLLNILSWGYDIDLSVRSLFICKIRVFIYTIFSLGSITCLCLAIIDQYFSTCSRPFWRRFSNIKLARYLTSIILIIYTIHAIPYFIYFNHIHSPLTNQTICQITNAKFIQYHTYGYFLTLTNILPILTAIGGWMAYRSAKRLSSGEVSIFQYELDKELTTMILIQILVYLCTFLPYSIQSMYALFIFNQNEPIFKAKMTLASIIMIYFSMLSYAVRFFLIAILISYSLNCLESILHLCMGVEILSSAFEIYFI